MADPKDLKARRIDAEENDAIVASSKPEFMSRRSKFDDIAGSGC